MSRSSTVVIRSRLSTIFVIRSRLLTVFVIRSRSSTVFVIRSGSSLKRTQFFACLNMLNILITWRYHISKIAYFSLHLCTKLMFNITYLKKTKSGHQAWPKPHFYTQVTWAWHIAKYEDNCAETFSPNIKCHTPHMLKCLYSPKQDVKCYLTSLHINEWTLAFTLTWPKTSSVHFLFPLLTLEWFFHYGTPFSQTQLNQLAIMP